MDGPIRIDIACLLGHSDWATIQSLVATLDREPSICGVWVNDHLVPIGPDTSPADLGAGELEENIVEGWTTLAAVAAVTARLRLGVMASSAILRSPPLLAHMASTVDRISGGRVDIAVGAAWNRHEYDSHCLPFPSLRARADAADEACRVLRQEAGGTDVGSPCGLGPLMYKGRAVDLWVAGKGERYMMPVAARWADWWNVGRIGPDSIAQKAMALKQHRIATGRGAEEEVRISTVMRLFDVRALSNSALRQRVQDMIVAGTRHLVVEIRGNMSELDEALDRVASITDVGPPA